MTRISTTELFERFDEETDRQHFEVLDEESMTVEVARYAAGTAEPKNPHTGDEIYYIISGSGMARAGDETYSVEAGDVVYVESGLEHDIFNIEEDITALLVLAGENPAEYTMREESEE
ncbi:cupin domain-containing protein [Halanaeroarchaeum sulfurireducens]|uniref:Mannose-1-phosphate guanylyltransferase (GDP) n=1 Tax=Halanaeroarchaeum sulfurireducens TaxID=1604004 RepID=A0A0F7P933_9EURY|nr:cupin domain-containing protein [Halanaeroarchaeum sulfurireducens]AKH97641.1 mannose-1-phosphate guanylyltransferase (GDP) [Halanaeroarchaeum sulfurireducens]